MAPKANVEECDDHLEGDTDENLTESIALIDQSFIKVMRKHDKRSINNVTSNVKHNQPQNSKDVNLQRKGKDGEKQSKGKGI